MEPVVLVGESCVAGACDELARCFAAAESNTGGGGGGGGTAAAALRRAEVLQASLKAAEAPAVLAAVVRGAAALVPRNQPLGARHAGYSLLQHCARHRIGELPAEARAELGQLALRLLADVAAGAAEEPFAIKGKVTSLLADLVRREGPPLLASVLPQLLGAARSGGPAQAELAALFLRWVPEELPFGEDDEKGSQMRAMLSALTGTLPEVLPFLYGLLETYYGAATRAVAAGNAAEARQHAAVVSAAVSAAEVNCEWAPLAALAQSGLLQALGYLLGSAEFRLGACAAIRHVSFRKRVGVGDEEAAMTAGLVQLCGALNNAATQVVAAADRRRDPEEEEFARRLADTVALFGQNHLGCIASAEVRTAFLERLAALLRFPSVHVVSAVLPCWLHVLRQAERERAKGGGAQGAAALPEGCVEVVLETCAQWLFEGGGLAVGLGLRSGGAAAQHWPEEFDSMDDLHQFWVSTRNRFMDTVKVCSTLAPCAALAVGVARFDAALALSASDELDASFEGAVSYIEPVLAAIALSNGTQGQPPLPADVAAAVERVLQQLLGLSWTSKPSLAAQQVRALEAFAPFAHSRADLATAMLTRVFTLFQAMVVDEFAAGPVRSRQKGAPRDPQAARQRMCTAILTVATNAAKALTPHLRSLVDQVNALQLKGTELGAVSESLLSVAAASSMTESAELLRLILGGVRARWTAAGAPELHQLVTGGAGASAARWEVFHDCQLVERCFRRVPAVKEGAPGADVFAAASRETLSWALPKIFGLLRALHALSTPAGRAHMGPAAEALAMSAEERAALLAVGAARVTVVPKSQVAPLSPELVDLREFLRGLRDTLYQSVVSVGTHAQHEFYGAAGMPEAIAAALFSDQASMEMRHWRLLIRISLQPLIACCPPAYRSTWLASLLPPVLPFTHDMLVREWGKLTTLAAGAQQQQQQQQEAAGQGGRDLSAEVLDERVLRDLTRDFVDLLHVLARTPEAPHRLVKAAAAAAGKPPPVAGKPSPDASTDDLLWLREMAPEMVLSLVSSAGAALTWPDSDAANKATLLCRVVVAAAAAVAPPSALHDVVGGELLVHALRALSLPTNGVHSSELVALSRDVMLRVSPLSSRPLEVLAQLPGLGPAGAAALVEDVRALRSDKDQRARLKQVLSECAGGPLAALEAAPTSSTGTVTVARLGAPARRGRAPDDPNLEQAASEYFGQVAGV